MSESDVNPQMWRRLSVLAALGLLLNYLLVAQGVLHGWEASINERVMRGELPGSNGFLQALSDATNNEPLFVAGVIVCLVLVAVRRWRQAWAFFLVNIVSATAVTILKDVVGRERPNNAAILWETASWPSGHTTGTMTFALALVFLVAPSRRSQMIVGAVVVPAAILVGYSRVFLGVHWPTDVAAGWLLSTLLVSLMVRLGLSAR